LVKPFALIALPIAFLMVADGKNSGQCELLPLEDQALAGRRATHAEPASAFGIVYLMMGGDQGSEWYT
jgi:hypothetical protein